SENLNLKFRPKAIVVRTGRVPKGQRTTTLCNRSGRIVLTRYPAAIPYCQGNAFRQGNACGSGVRQFRSSDFAAQQSDAPPDQRMISALILAPVCDDARGP